MPNCPGAKLSGAKLSWCQIVLVPNCPLLLSWCQIVRFYYLGAKLSPLLSWCQIVRCQIVRCQIVRCQIVLAEYRADYLRTQLLTFQPGAVPQTYPELDQLEGAMKAFVETVHCPRLIREEYLASLEKKR